jgi:hypothetical protein
MPNLWDVVTGNSNLPVQAGNSFWDHLQNQKSGGTGIDRTFSGLYKSTVSNRVKSQLVSNNVKSRVTSVISTSKLKTEVISKVSK